MKKSIRDLVRDNGRGVLHKNIGFQIGKGSWALWEAIKAYGHFFSSLAPVFQYSFYPWAPLMLLHSPPLWPTAVEDSREYPWRSWGGSACSSGAEAGWWSQFPLPIYRQRVNLIPPATPSNSSSHYHEIGWAVRGDNTGQTQLSLSEKWCRESLEKNCSCFAKPLTIGGNVSCEMHTVT